MIRIINGLFYECISPSFWRLKVPYPHNDYKVDIGYLGPVHQWATRLTRPDGEVFIKGNLSRADAFKIIEMGYQL